MRVRPNPREVERAAELLVEAKRPLLIVGDELYKTNSVDKAVKLAELLGMPVIQARQVFANFPQTHPLWVGGGVRSHDPDVVINVGNKLQHRRSEVMVPPEVKFIDMRIDSYSIGNVISTDVPLVADVAYGLEDLLTAVGSLMTPTIEKKAWERTEEARKVGERRRKLRSVLTKGPFWDQSPLLSERVTYEVAQFADQNAIIVDESGTVGGRQFFDFNPLGGLEHFNFYGGHLGSAVGRAAGVKLARPKQQVIALVGDGALIFGPTALWNMARLELPVIVVVYNNHAYGGPHSRVISAVPNSRMLETGRFVHDYLGQPDMNMEYLAKAFGVEGQAVHSPAQLQQALVKARRVNAEGKPYLIDAQVARIGRGWVDKPWTPSVDLT